MPANAVFDFILGLLHDPETAAAYCANPDATLAAAGLGDVSHEDIAAVAPLVAESGLFTGVGADLTSILNAGTDVDARVDAGLGTGAGHGVAGLGTGVGDGVDAGLSGVGGGVAGVGAGAGHGVAGLGAGVGEGVAGIGTGVGDGVAGIGTGVGGAVSG